MAELFETKNEAGAELSPCRKYRYALWRHWDWQDRANCVMFVGLNPSTADETKDDPTIRKCIGFARRWGFGGLYMLNLYAFRATKPIDMVQAVDSVGPKNLESFGYYRNCVGLIVAAWGALENRFRPRVRWQSHIAEVQGAIGRPMDCLKLTQGGDPWHPLYVPYDIERLRFWNPLNPESPQ